MNDKINEMYTDIKDIKKVVLKEQVSSDLKFRGIFLALTLITSTIVWLIDKTIS